jgi:hypothetical protein
MNIDRNVWDTTSHLSLWDNHCSKLECLVCLMCFLLWSSNYDQKKGTNSSPAALTHTTNIIQNHLCIRGHPLDEFKFVGVKLKRCQQQYGLYMTRIPLDGHIHDDQFCFL